MILFDKILPRIVMQAEQQPQKVALGRSSAEDSQRVICLQVIVSQKLEGHTKPYTTPVIEVTATRKSTVFMLKLRHTDYQFNINVVCFHYHWRINMSI